MTTVHTSPKLHKQSWLDHLRLVWTLASKDIVDALKTKTTLTTIIITLLMVLFYRYFPALTTGDEALKVMLYAETESEVAMELERSPALAVYTFDSRQQLMNAFEDGESVELAVVIPDTVEAQRQSGEPITIEGHLMYWVSPAKRAEIKTLVEDDLSTQLGQPVILDIDGNDVQFNADVPFFVFSSTFALLFVTLMIGISLIPNLMVEEKQAKTLDALMVSPASAAHLVAGKTVAGLFYGLVGTVIVFIVFRHLIVQWDIAFLAAGLVTLLMVAIGLLLGSYVKVRSQLQLVAWFIVLPLLVPVFLVEMEGLIPSGAISVMKWIPTVLIAKTFRMSLTPNATLAHYGPAVAVTIVATLALLALVVLVIRRADRG
jgi:ABC-2 type transport system permease protein